MPKTLTPEEEFDNVLFAGRERPLANIQPNLAVPSNSEQAAGEDVDKIFSLKKRFEKAAQIHEVPPELLEGIASRESRVGSSLNPKGYDPQKKAYGLMQIDERYHKRVGKTPDSQEHINQAAGILREYRNDMDRKFPDWSDEDRWRGAVAAYNMGPGNVKSREKLDVGTTGNNYSSDVMLRSKVFREKMSAMSKRK